jgi:hypothetical protein
MYKLIAASVFLLFSFSVFASIQQLDVALRDGRNIKVEKSIEQTTKLRILDPFFGLIPMPRLTNGGDVTTLKFKNPDTQQVLTWVSEPYYEPVLLDFLNGVPFIVVHGQISKDVESVYGCPELPYFYLKYEAGIVGKWRSIPVEKVPDILRKANLIIEHKDDGGFFQQIIPRAYNEWNYSSKNAHFYERNAWDCRPPSPPFVSIKLPQAPTVDTEVLDTKEFEPERIYKQSEWSPHHFFLNREKSCENAFVLADRYDTYKGRRFTGDKTRLKEVPYTSSFGQSEANALCDEGILFISEQDQPNSFVFSKYTFSGDLLFRVAGKRPEPIKGYFLAMRIPSIRIDTGYFYFEYEYFSSNWSKQIGESGKPEMEWHVKKVIAMRIREPQH